jgi:heme A synthase
VPLLWGLHVAAIAAFAAMIISSRRSESQADGFTMPEWPAWAFLLAGAAFLYAGINFAAFVALSQGGTPEIRDGGFVLSDHGRIIRALTADEYRWQQVYIVRGFSGHWMFFLLLPTMYFAFRGESDHPQASSPPAV